MKHIRCKKQTNKNLEIKRFAGYWVELKRGSWAQRAPDQTEPAWFFSHANVSFESPDLHVYWRTHRSQESSEGLRRAISREWGLKVSPYSCRSITLPETTIYQIKRENIFLSNFSFWIKPENVIKMYILWISKNQGESEEWKKIGS